MVKVNVDQAEHITGNDEKKSYNCPKIQVLGAVDSMVMNGGGYSVDTISGGCAPLEPPKI